MKGRAETPEQKRAIIERLYAAWLSQPQQRLGQLVLNSIRFEVESPETALFYVEDDGLIERVEKFARGEMGQGLPE